MPDSVPTGAHTTRHGSRRLRWWTELPLLALLYVGYWAVRIVVAGGEDRAVRNGLDILALERTLHLDAESPLNRLFTEQPLIGVPADFFYASLHYLMTVLLMLWLWHRRPARYRAARTWLLVSSVLALIGFALYPVCPPRLLDAGHGFVDTMAQYASYGWWGGAASVPRGMGSLTNQFAAMPSLHVGWALWCGVVLWRYGRGPLARAAGVAYPLLTSLVVMGTANHYFLDVVGGVAVMALGLLLVRPLLRLADRARERFAGARAREGARAPDRAPVRDGA
ncbi:phosphatase PAP2 family protein, partial [Streptomyces sp. Ru87]|uniref:phosphatase PAP2 family protein n=1 Tax=Streptomyces sp. Ru87 TaxID=2044307 RepID=UPI000BF3F1A4